MRIRYSMFLSIFIAVLSPHASGGVGMTNIVQLHAPMLFHSDGSAYTENDMTILGLTQQASTAYEDGVADLRTPTGQLANCSGPGCTEQPFGFLPGAALPSGGTLRSAELDRRNFDTLMHDDAYQYARSDLYLEVTGDGAPYGTFSQAGGWTNMRFQVAETDSMHLRFGWQQYLYGFYDAGTQPGSYVQTDTRLSFELYDQDTSSYVMRFSPQTIVRLDGTGPLEIEQAGGMQYFSIWGGQLTPGHTYSLAFSQSTYSRGMIASAVPEPSAMLMYFGGLALLLLPFARRRIPWARRTLASLVLVMPAAAWAGDGSSAVVGLDLYGPRLLHSDGTRYEWNDFKEHSPISTYGTTWTEANRLEDISGTIAFPNGVRQLLHVCTGTDCPASGFPATLTGDTADVSHQTWQMSDFVAADAYQHTQVIASALAHASHAEIRTHTEMWNFNVTSPDSMTIEFDARAFGLAQGDASATISFRAWLKENYTGGIFDLMPDALNVQLHSGEGAYDSGRQTFSFNVPTVFPGPGYFLVFEQTLIASAVPEPAPVALYCAGFLALLAWPAKRRAVVSVAAPALPSGSPR